jgi:hypothetical protein
VSAHGVEQLLLEGAPGVADFREAGRDDNERLDAGGGALVHHVDDDVPGDGHEREIYVVGRVADRGVAAPSFELGGLRVDRIQVARETGGDHRAKRPAADALRVARRADDRDVARRQQRTHRRDRRQRLPALGGGHRFGSGAEREQHGDRSAFGLRADLESRVVEYLEHRRVFGQDRRFEPPESVRRGRRRQPLQQDRAETFALEAVGHRECRFGDAVAEVQIRSDRNRPQLAVDEPECQVGDLARRIRRVAERVDQPIGRIAEREEPPPVRFRRELVEETAQRVAILRNRQSDGRKRAVAQDDARLRSIGRRQRRTHDLHG